MAKKREIEEHVRLSTSTVWNVNRAYYSERGVRAWSADGLPFQVTSNPFVADSFAQLIRSWIRDASVAQSSVHPYRIVELGAGTGQLGWHICRELLKDTALPDWTYTFTDLSERNVQAMRQHPRLIKLLQRPEFTVETYDVESNAQLPVGPGPAIVIATYVFDAVRQDAFEISEGSLYECHAALTEHTGDHTGLDRLGILNERRDFTPYGRSDWDRILTGYQSRLPNAFILFPTAALQFVERILKVRNELLLITCDKGYNHEIELIDAAAPELTAHGSLSMMVNFDALGKWTDLHGGHRFHEPERDVSLVSAAFGFGVPSLPETSNTFRQVFSDFGPGDYYDLHAAFDFDAEPAMPLEPLLALLRLGRFDPRLYYRMSDCIQGHIADMDEEQSRRMVRIGQKVLQHTYPLMGTADTAFSVGLLFYDLDHYAEAIEAFNMSRRWYGPAKEVEHNIGLCLHALSRPADALVAFERAYELDPDWPEAQEALSRLRIELNVEGIDSMGTEQSPED
ncbi:MAG: SAM-dependent methyltransferase [Myxococcota bacterium]|nr:SAM-dependent methyltransferase [Myxococcota bacterium]